jgi:hypothetical protein
MSTLAPISDESKLAHGFNVLRQWADTLIEELPSMSRDQVMDCARNANEMETQAFRIRGACAAEMRRRMRESCMGDEAKIGEAFDGLARDIGVHVITLRDDARIYETFGSEIIVNNYLPREVYRLALTAKDPRGAVEMYAKRKAIDERYSTLDFRRDMSDVNKGKELRPEAVSDSDEREVTWGLRRHVLRDLKELADSLSCDHELAVSYAIKYAARAHKEGHDIRSRI